MQTRDPLKDERDRHLLFLGIGCFIFLFSVIRLVMSLVFGIEVEGWSRRFGNFDETFYWIVLVLGFAWIFFGWKGYQKFRKEHPEVK